MYGEMYVFQNIMLPLGFVSMGAGTWKSDACWMTDEAPMHAVAQQPHYLLDTCPWNEQVISLATRREPPVCEKGRLPGIRPPRTGCM